MQNGFPSSISSSSDELSYVKPEVIFMKSVLFAMSDDDANSTVVTVSMGPLLELEFYVGIY